MGRHPIDVKACAQLVLASSYNLCVKRVRDTDTQEG